MVDTVRTLPEILALLPDNATGEISPQDMRDQTVSLYRPFDYDTRAAMIADAVGRTAAAEGDVVTAGLLSYQKSTGATDITDIPDWVPFGVPEAGHFDDDLVEARAFAVTTPYSGLISSQRFREFSDDFIQMFGGIGIQDEIDTTKKRSTFRLDRKITDLATADLTDPESGSFTIPQMLEMTYKVDGEIGADGSGARGCRMVSTNLTNNSNQNATTNNWTIRNGGISPSAVWGGVIEGYDISSANGLSDMGDPDQDPTADVMGVVGNNLIGLEINGKMKVNTGFIGLQIMPRTYGRVVTDASRPKADRCIFLGPSRNGSDDLSGSYLDDAEGADILRQIDMSSGPADGSSSAASDYGIWSREPFEIAFIAMPLNDIVVFDNDAGSPNQVQMFAPFAGNLVISCDGDTNRVAQFSTSGLTLKNSLELDTQSTTAQNRSIDWSTEGKSRWKLKADNASEAGSNAGSDLRLSGFEDDGTTETTVMVVTRSTQVVDFKTQVRISSIATSAAGLSTGDLWSNSGVVTIV